MYTTNEKLFAIWSRMGVSSGRPYALTHFSMNIVSEIHTARTANRKQQTITTTFEDSLPRRRLGEGGRTTTIRTANCNRQLLTLNR